MHYLRTTLKSVDLNCKLNCFLRDSIAEFICEFICKNWRIEDFIQLLKLKWSKHAIRCGKLFPYTNTRKYCPYEDYANTWLNSLLKLALCKKYLDSALSNNRQQWPSQPPSFPSIDRSNRWKHTLLTINFASINELFALNQCFSKIITRRIYVIANDGKYSKKLHYFIFSECP